MSIERCCLIKGGHPAAQRSRMTQEVAHVVFLSPFLHQDGRVGGIFSFFFLYTEQDRQEANVFYD